MGKRLLLVILTCIFLAGCTTNTTQRPGGTPVAQASSKPIKLDTFGTAAPTPTLPAMTPGGQIPTPPPAPIGCDPGNTGWPILGNNNGQCCVQDGPAHNAGECCPGVPSGVPHCFGPGGEVQCPYTAWCDAKPVIYLYPERPTAVNVRLTVPGDVIASDPQYPPDGWRNVLAMPGGNLFYQGKSYRELFYEASVVPITPPSDGITVQTNDLEPTLRQITNRLGLIRSEQDELVAYWVPRLRALDAPYIFISYFEPEQKEIIDTVDISPTPDTFIQFILYFRPEKSAQRASSLKLPDTPTLRSGFTAVEWGGIIDDK